MCCVSVLLCLAAAVWRGLSLSPQVVVIENAVRESWKFPWVLGTPAGPSRTRVIWRRRINARARGYVPGANDIPGSGGSEKRHVHGTKMHGGTRQKQKERPLRRRQNEKRPAPFCALRVAQAPRARDFPFMIVAHYQHAPLAGQWQVRRLGKHTAHGPTSRDSPTNDDHLLNGDHGALAATDLA